MTKVQGRRVADEILKDLLDRRGIRQALEPIKHGDTEVWNEIRDSIGKLAWAAVEREQGGAPK